MAMVLRVGAAGADADDARRAGAGHLSSTRGFFERRVLEARHDAVPQAQLGDRELQLLRRQLEELPLHLERGRAHRRRLGGHRLDAARRGRVLGRAGVGVLDLDPVQGHAQLLGDDHGHDRLGAGADVGGPHVEVRRAVGEELDDDRRRRPAGAGDPECRRPCRRRASQGPLPGARRRASSQPNALAPSSRHCSGPSLCTAGCRVAWVTAGTFFSRSSTGSMPMVARQRVHHLLERPRPLRVAGSAEGRAGPVVVSTSVACTTLGHR